MDEDAAPRVAALEASDVYVHFGGVHALDGVDLTLHRGEILGLIGPNGAGKTTLVNVLTGFQRPTRGRVLIDGKDVTGAGAGSFARRGVSRTFQAARVFGGLTVLENVELGAVGLGMGRRKAQEQALELLDQVGFADQAYVRADALPFGEERRVGLLRAVAMRPAFLLLDEPAAGLNERESDMLATAVRAIRDQLGCGVLLIDHDVRVIMDLCERIEVLDHGKAIAVGAPDQIRNDPIVATAYLGTAAGRVSGANR